MKKIQQGDKIKFIYLKEPNPISGMKGDKVISFPASIPKELDIHRFVDYNMQFTKSFLDPLKQYSMLLDGSPKEEATLEGTVYMRVEIEYKDLIFLQAYLLEQSQDLDKKVKESYMDEETPLEEISSLGKIRDDLNKIASEIKKQL